jgi:phosphoribosylaminoimidazolecarboxamide formyltransferase/IMP cyclohydrolase
VLEELRSNGAISPGTRRRLALEAFHHTAAYDAAIASYLSGGEEFPDRLVLTGHKISHLRYGENPHQSAALYAGSGPRRGLAAATQLHGKELSYNNLLDTDAAWKLARELPGAGAAIIKHSNPCGVAVGRYMATAYTSAYECDTQSAFGGIVALNRPCDAPTAEAIAKVFTEVVIAPNFDDAALEILTAKKNLRILRASDEALTEVEVRRISGGLLLQSPDPHDDASDAKVVTKVEPTEAQLTDLCFAWVVCKHVKSNAIVLAADGVAFGVGAGQMSRVEAAALAGTRAGNRAQGSVCASDAFFPFRDGLDAVVQAGARAVIQPGGSVNDDEVIAAADDHGIPMLFTGRRHFRH